MTKDDLPRLGRVLAILGETFNEPVSDVRAEGYLMGLNDLPIEQVELGARRALKESKFFPRPAELREFAVGSDNDCSEMAWLELQREVRRTGLYGQPVLKPEVHAAMTLVFGNWRDLCANLPNSGPELLGWAKRFKSAFESVSRGGRLKLESITRRQLDA